MLKNKVILSVFIALFAVQANADMRTRPVQAATQSEVNAGVISDKYVSPMTLASKPFTGWLLSGNSGTNPALNFIGTTDNQNMVVKTNNQNTAIFVSDGGDFTPSLIVGNDANLTRYQTNTSAKSFIDSTSSGYVALNQNNQVFTVRNGSGALGFRLNRANGTYDAPTGILNGWQLGDLSWNTYTGLPASPTTSVRSARIIVTAVGNHIGGTNGAAKFAIEHIRSGWGNATESLRLLGDNAGIGFNNTPVTTWEVGKYTAANALPAATGTAQSAGHIQRLTSNGNNTTLDLGTDATQSWIQSVDKSNLATNRALLLNPNRGNVGVSTTQALSSLDVDGSLGLAIRVTAIPATLGTSDSTVILTAAVTQPLPAPILRRVYHIKNGGAGTVTVTGHIDNTAANTIIIPSGSSRTFHSDGTTWWII